MLLRMENVERYLGKGYKLNIARNQGVYHVLLSGVRSRKDEREILSIIEKKIVPYLGENQLLKLTLLRKFIVNSKNEELRTEVDILAETYIYTTERLTRQQRWGDRIPKCTDGVGFK